VGCAGAPSWAWRVISSGVVRGTLTLPRRGGIRIGWWRRRRAARPRCPARRFAHAATGDQAVARAISRPTVLDRYQPHRHRRWNQGCHDAAMLHAEITALGYRGSIRTVYRYLQPLRTGTDPAASPRHH